METAQILIRYKWLNFVYPHNGILFSHKKDWSTVYAVTWMNFENIMLNEQTKRQMSHTVWFQLHAMSRVGASMMIRDDQWLPRAGEMGAVRAVWLQMYSAASGVMKLL